MNATSNKDKGKKIVTREKQSFPISSEKYLPNFIHDVNEDLSEAEKEVHQS